MVWVPSGNLIPSEEDDYENDEKENSYELTILMMMMTTVVMMIIGGIVVIVASSGCLIPSANYGGDSTKWHRHFTLMVDGDDDDDDDDCDDDDLDDNEFAWHSGVLCSGESYTEAKAMHLECVVAQ